MDEKKKIKRLKEIAKSQPNIFDYQCIYAAITALEEISWAKKVYGEKAFLNIMTHNKLQEALEQWLFHNNSTALRNLAKGEL